MDLPFIAKSCESGSVVIGVPVGAGNTGGIFYWNILEKKIGIFFSYKNDVSHDEIQLLQLQQQ